MFSIQKFFGKDPIFFDLFEQSADQILVAANSLIDVLKSPNDPSVMQPIKEARRKSKEITEQLQELVIKTFVTSLEREDIEALSTTLYRVLKPIEKFAERYRIAIPVINESDFIGQVRLIIDSAEHLREMVRLVRKSGNLDQARRINSSIKQAESDADSLEIELLRILYANEATEPRRIFIAKDMFNLLEKGIDRCRDAAGVIMQIVLKNS